jgi:hypothetical protein
MNIANKYDSYEWVLKVVKSCATKPQIANVGKLIYNFSKMYKDPYLYNCLKYYKQFQRDKILAKDREL